MEKETHPEGLWDHDGGRVWELSRVHEGGRFAFCGPSTVGLLLSSTGKLTNSGQK